MYYAADPREKANLRKDLKADTISIPVNLLKIQ